MCNPKKQNRPRGVEETSRLIRPFWVRNVFGIMCVYVWYDNSKTQRASGVKFLYGFRTKFVEMYQFLHQKQPDIYQKVERRTRVFFFRKKNDKNVRYYFSYPNSMSSLFLAKFKNISYSIISFLYWMK